MSSERGNDRKSGQRHQNSYKFTHNRHSKKTKLLLTRSKIEGLCRRCTDKLEWRKDYRKYKPLTQPKKCVKCEKKQVNRAYHIVCEPCSVQLKICAKCLEVAEIIEPFDKSDKQVNDEKLLAKLPERKRRTYLRLIERGYTAKLATNGDVVFEAPEGEKAEKTIQIKSDAQSDEEEDMIDVEDQNENDDSGMESFDEDILDSNEEQAISKNSLNQNKPEREKSGTKQSKFTENVDESEE